MPLFEYQCGRCGHVFEHFTFGEGAVEDRTCPKCEAPGARKVISPFASLSGGEGDKGCGSGGCGSGSRGFS
jgi:putative FmdB family regulatory protein